MVVLTAKERRALHKEDVMKLINDYIKTEKIPWVPYTYLRKEAKNRWDVTKRKLDGILAVLENDGRLDDVELKHISRTWLYFPTRVVKSSVKSET